MRIRKDVEDALEKGVPVVSLESTIIAHGMPYPQNVEVALELERVAREMGCIPATVGVVNGEVVVGMTEQEIELIGREDGVLKLSTRDIPLCVAKGLSGATTVSATSFIAHKVGIVVFATGGIGGVHRDFGETVDVSRDLEELSYADIVVVSSGAKSVLDLRKTIEYLETKGVLVLGFRTSEFPAFYTRRSGITVPSVDSVEDIAKIYREKKELSITSAVLVANPIPVEHEIPKDTVDEWIEAALTECKRDGVSGKDVTPYLLSKVEELSAGKSLEANIHLVKSNVRLASEIAMVLSR
ncbi:MAG: pseudouridine-5'-phosphate glycosidase [Synergistetes bacterium]|nr:pseudouridine-5'-phosphate glycosidase [Synergistota bacterium]